MKRKGLSAAVIKNIAAAAMLIDHIGAFLLLHLLPAPASKAPLYVLCRRVGRTSFPIYCFLISEGAVRTEDRRRYALRLFATGLLSEIPFSLASSGKVLDFEDTNVFFSLLLGLISICLHDLCRESSGKGIAGTAASLLCTAACCAAAVLIHCDYLLLGPLLIMTFYVTRDDPNLRLMASSLTLAGGSVLMYWFYFADRYSSSVLWEKIMDGTAAELFALPSLLLIRWYSGEKGRQLPRAFYYLFYPAHILLLWLIRKALTGH